MTDPTHNKLFDLTGKTALVTGGSGYLGGALCQALAEAGASVVVASRDASRAQAVAGQLPARGDATHHGVVLDHLDEDALNRGFEAALQCTGSLDILVNNAHAVDGNDWTSVDAEAFNRQMANASGYFLLARRLRDHVVERGRSGSVVLLGSMYGMVGSYPDAYEGIGPANPVHYQTLKGGVVQMARHLAVYWAKDRVRVNCLSPGPFPSPATPVPLVERLNGKSPMGRMGLPHELAGALLLLASPAGSYITGHNLVVDGGWTAW